MLTLKIIREQTDFVIERLRIKNFDASELALQIIAVDNERKVLQTALDANLSQQNMRAKQIGILMQQGKRDEAEAAKQQTAQLKEQSKTLEQQLSDTEKQRDNLLVLLPNLPSEQVPAGRTPDDNVIIREGGKKPVLPQALPHWELAAKYNLIDFELGVKLTGAGFPVYKDKGAKLQRALITYFLDCNTAAGYTEVQPPLMVNETSGFGTGNLPDKEGQMYHVGIDNFYLIPTAEVPVTNIYRDVILNASELPVKLTAYTPCFRREAGSYGKDVRGLNRLHQFDKVEIVQLQLPQNSYATLDEMVRHVENIVQSLELPYRIIKLCGGDMSFTSAMTFDFEVFSAAQERWLEVSSVSNFESFQANRLKLRYRDETKKTQLAHTLNGSSLALPRIVAALLENNQTPEGIRIPKALQAYTGFEMIEEQER
ncbi:MAG: serine--tRNA ligase [Prevotellaceae bacterium]|jgi:seryl-tRNA synthetase|nr:serine--tRNA ligase [Prevotellaceae bacterium]